MAHGCPHSASVTKVEPHTMDLETPTTVVNIYFNIPHSVVHVYTNKGLAVLNLLFEAHKIYGKNIRMRIGDILRISYR